MARKFIITEKQMVMGNVELHMDLVKSISDKSLPVLGGGRFYIDKYKEILYLWGESIDFGYANPEDIKRAIESPETFLSPFIENFKVLHCPYLTASMPDESDFTFLTVIPS